MVNHRTTMRNMTLPLSLVLAALASASLPVQAQYTAYDLGFGDAYAINSSGTVVGFSGTMETHRAFSYSGGVMTDLGTLGGGNSVACSINNFGVVAGRSDISSGSWRGFSYSGGQMADLGVLSSGYSDAYGINDSGTIVGSVWTTGNMDHAAYYSGAHWTDLGTLGGNYSAAAAINSAGTIVGWSDLSVGTHAFSYRAGVMTDLGTLEGSGSYAMDINDSGTIVGYANDHAFCYSAGVMRGIGTLAGGYSSYANAINSSGTVVGNSTIDAKGDHHAFLYNGSVLSDLGPYLVSIGLTGSSAASDIDDRGDIVGSAYDARGQLHAFLLTAGQTMQGRP